MDISNIVAVFPEGSEKGKSSHDDVYGHGQEKRRPSTDVEGKTHLSPQIIKHVTSFPAEEPNKSQMKKKHKPCPYISQLILNNVMYFFLRGKQVSPNHDLPTKMNKTISYQNCQSNLNNSSKCSLVPS